MSELQPSIFIIFGGTGDLAQRKLIPAIARLVKASQFNKSSHVIAVGRGHDISDEGYRDLALKALEKSGHQSDAMAELVKNNFHYQGVKGKEEFQGLADRLSQIEKEFDLPGNRTFYLALPPPAFAPTIQGLGSVGLNESRGYTRLVIEKPFGHDLESAQALNAVVHANFDESQIYRIDHYLAKETVQNLLVFRFGNLLLESAWNRDRIESVQVTVAESLGVGSRAGYYDKSGALRDMVQNHITQLISLVAMEAPVQFTAEHIRYEKVKVLKSIGPILPGDVVFGQYSAGMVGDEKVHGYHDEPDVPNDSITPTFVSMKLSIDNWRWQGVPFYVRTGKRLPQRVTEIAIRFRRTPVCLFPSEFGCLTTADALIITLQPDEGFSLLMDVKSPGDRFDVRQIPLSFKYSELFDDMPEAYQTLIHDVLEGDQTLFVHADEVENSWRIYQPLLTSRIKPATYHAGTWGPSEADHLALSDRKLWQPEQRG